MDIYGIYHEIGKTFPERAFAGGQTSQGIPFSGKEVLISKEGNRVILEPVESAAWPEGFFESIRIADKSFVRPPQGEMPPPPDFQDA